jgi:hypothetical protein
MDPAEPIHRDIRQVVRGTTARPRLVLFRSLKHTYAQARSTVTGLFDNVQVVTVVGFTDPRLAIDTPAPGATPGQPFMIAGWALDLGAATGTGIDTVHVYAFLAGGGAPVFLGEARSHRRRGWWLSATAAARVGRSA